MLSNARVAANVLWVALLVACSQGSPAGPTVGTTEQSASSSPDSSAPTTATPGQGCPSSGDGVAWRDDATIALEQIATGEGGETVYAAEYPLPGPTEGLWTQWGQGIALEDGRHLSAVGDHLGFDGNSWFFAYDPETRALTRFGDVLSVVPHEAGSFGYGKVHAQMVLDRCGSVWAGTYWGTRDDLSYRDGYEGDRLLRIDPGARTISDQGAFAGEHGSPTMTLAQDGRSLVAGSVEPLASDEDEDRGVITIYDTVNRETVQQVDDPRQIGFRALGIDPVSGGVFYSIGRNGLAAVDPASGEFHDLDVTMPGWWLRSTTRPAPDGTVYGAADDEPGLFSIAPDGELRSLGDPGGSTTSIAMSPDGSRIFWMPEAHGDAWEIGAPVMSMETATGETNEVVSLLDPFRDQLGLLPGGTYSVVYDQGSLVIGVNASPVDAGEDAEPGFGTVVLVVVEGV